MINLTKQTAEKLGFPTIREELAKRTSTDAAKEICLEILPFEEFKPLLRELTFVNEARAMIDADEGYYLEYAGSIDYVVREARIKGNWLSKEEVFALYKWLKMVKELASFFKRKNEKYPNLTQLAGKLQIDPDLLNRVEIILDEKGNVKDTASDELRKIRRDQARAGNELRKVLASTLRKAIDKGWSNDSEITIRNDRLVIPMLADFKGRIKGFIQDVSQSGQTIFIEPTEALEFNNRLRQLQGQEQKEIVRIFTEFTDEVRNNSRSILAVADVVTHLDIIRAKARFAVAMKAELPKINADAKKFNLIQAYHPILLIKAGFDRRKVIPLSLEMNNEQRVILISGPNAGGKSVSLKTVGLLQLMLQSGLLIPASEFSEFRLFDKIFVDIGDEQSIQSDLSTYTSHLKVMREMLEGLNPGSLFLLDEFGTGTDPRMGGAMAEAFLEKFVESGGFGVITTHYGNLKAYADNTPAITNASMMFDPKNLSPTYQLELGIPGRSYAFEIARKAGIPDRIIDQAKDKMEGGEVYAEELLLKLEEQRSQLETLLMENKQTKAELSRLMQKNLTLNKNLEIDKSRIIRNAHEQAENLIKTANSKIENTIREIREIQAEKEQTKSLRKELTEMLPEPPPDLEEFAEKKIEEDVVVGVTPEVGDKVKMTNSDAVGNVLEINGKRAVVALGDLRVTAKLKDLQKLKSNGKPISDAAKSRRVSQINKKASISRELNVMGLRVEAAMPIVAKFLDDAILAGLKQVRILHGKGTGALRNSIREQLRAIPEVSKFRDEHFEAGGDGWTIVELKD